jgi:nitrile hydratase accessory protein
MQNTHLTLEEIALHCGGQMPLPVQDGKGTGTVFSEPWQAHAFAMTLHLHEKGLFTWPEWAAALTQEISNAQQAGDADTGATYYTHWLNALEAMVLAKQWGTAEQIHDLEHAWEDAAARTPHGQPIVLEVQGSGVSVSN